MSLPHSSAPLLAWYGDDFTGSTDVMEALTLNGVDTVLAPSPGLLQAALTHRPQARAVGIAGLSRSLPTPRMREELEPALRQLHSLRPHILHYKICSTFDSSPQIGSIGEAIAIGREITGATHVPLLVAAPRLKRYVAFANLFATVGDHTFRLDRHPTMSRHPVTPMAEADLRQHLAHQTPLPVESIDLLTLQSGQGTLRSKINQWLNTRPDGGLAIFDGISESDLALTGRLLWEERQRLGRLVVGSSGVEWALAQVWHTERLVDAHAPIPSVGAIDRLLVVSGSVSPVTAAQIENAAQIGYRIFSLNLPELLLENNRVPMVSALVNEITGTLHQGQSTVVCSARGAGDPIIQAARQAYANRPHALEPAIGTLLAELLAGVLKRCPLPRICVCGGDTSGRVARTLGLEALTLAAPLAPGAPLCRAFRSGQPPLEIVLKGGQNGSPHFFESVRLGRSEISPTSNP